MLFNWCIVPAYSCSITQMHHYTWRKCNWFISCNITFYTISTHSAFTIKKPIQNIMTRLSCSCERSLMLDQRSVGCFGILAKCIAVVILNSWRWLNSALNRTQLEDEIVATLLSKIDWLQLWCTLHRRALWLDGLQ